MKYFPLSTRIKKEQVRINDGVMERGGEWETKRGETGRRETFLRRIPLVQQIASVKFACTT
jgi:hypothetical protein